MFAITDTFYAEIALRKYNEEEGLGDDEEEIKRLNKRLKKLKNENKILLSENDELKSKLSRRIENSLRTRIMSSPSQDKLDYLTNVAAEKEEYDLRISQLERSIKKRPQSQYRNSRSPPK